MMTSRLGRGAALSLAGLACACLPPSAIAQQSLGDALSASTTSLSLRLRHESSAQDNALRDARANGLRHRLGLSTGSWYGLSATLESEGVVALGDERYNSGPGGNGQTDYSVVADPTGNEVNQAFLHYRTTSGTQLRVGRQRIIFDNARFVGNVGWRQNEQTYDAALLTQDLAAQTTLKYAYLGNVNRIFFDDVNLDGHLLNIHTRLAGGLAASIYGYWLDYTRGEDTQTVGLRLSGTRPWQSYKLHYTAEFARQDAYADSSGFDADYRSGELGLARGGLGLALGLEVLDGDGTRGFATPLATLHKFNGFADMFLATPGDGLSDSYLKLSLKRGRWSALAFYHQFESARGSLDYGSEFDAVMVYKYSGPLSLGFKYADYTADGFGVDTRKFTVDLDYSF